MGRESAWTATTLKTQALSRMAALSLASQKPLFVAWRSVERIIVAALTVVLVGGLACALILVGLIAGSGAGLLLIGFGAFFVLIMVFGARSLLGDWRYAFYDDHFEVSHAGRNDCSVPLSEIGAVRCAPYDWPGAIPSKVPLSYRHRPRIVINTYTSHEDRSFEVFQNPYNREIKMHLCDWLTQKTEAHKVRERSEAR